MKKIKNLINWCKKLIYIVNNYDLEIKNLSNRIDCAESNVNKGINMIKKRTKIHADVSYFEGSPTQIITIGRYRNRDYIQVFSLHNDNDFKMLIEKLREMERYGDLERIDCPIGLEAVLDRELHGKW